MRSIVLFENHAGFKKGLLGYHGFSLFIDYDGRRILVDVGTEGKILLHNMKALEIDPEKIDAVVLTHGHYDHTGGLREFLRVRRSTIDIYAHPEIFLQRIALKPKLRDIGIPYLQEELETLGANFILDKKPLKIFDGVWTSGEIKRVTWDRRVGYIVKDNGLIKDPVRDDIALVVEDGESVIVITGCGHSGILNIVMHAQNLLNKPIKALIGGFHLMGSDEKLRRDAIRGLKDLGVQKLYAGHCTGFEAMASFMYTVGKNFEPLYVGKVIEL
ncbi:MBL fold metallo-hydrolase [Thermococcus sp. MV5]|uniref:MBL fold metallo-hydrolase n=1 Tax=Thermococcus sp. MV5 TaxID=1638272 RepID=UPI00143AF36B|nr:MBL fold metallo-hydrolase [Thermococcus sp. MV5]NJE25101.1 MBL fold metallo-hydrolase [Thermococcus sp. MV5]